MSWPNFWYKKNWLSGLLWPVSKLVCLEAERRLKKFNQTRQADAHGAKVIVVGNLVVGGSGKTPLIIWLTRALQQRGLKVGIVSRGYGGQSQTWPQAVTPESNPILVGDEPLLLAKQLQVPIAVGPKRDQAIALIEKEQACDVILSDDGLQHFGMQRDIELVVVDGERQFGNGWCLPAGPLREPLQRITAVDAVVINGDNQLKVKNSLQKKLPPRYGMQLKPTVLRNLLNDKVTLAVETFSGQEVNAIAGIGNPKRFFDTLEPYVAKQNRHPFKDHQAYNRDDLKGFDPQKPLIMTSKDAVKCLPIAQQLNAKNWWVLEVETQVDNELLTLILQKLQN
ncbi:tetraacyldisaccharide 4'-kinase [Thiomicrorhabdus xiamenensis]|uniref:Tetraacyldisaccharide 4'-kinase n=1 Tax=Thiomicrorhabdus xiamenensis TaxID=2739063 RepID=A0A7D4SYG3_9GAMM|nr:tetraacyldisaccharide 4'-kinase [Thiomicrorhabdus xiamenensis]QKI89024.1 tetraacyldisaccharide 4'-kinase [Thiomicrorhabdus xiamenensis]